MTNKELDYLMKLIDQYGYERMLDNEYDNADNVQKAREKVVAALEKLK